MGGEAIIWREISANDTEGINEIVNLWNNRLGCTFTMDKDMIVGVLNKRLDAHYYLFEGTYINVLLGYKHDISDDTTYIFSISSGSYITELSNAQKTNEMWDAYQLIITLLLKKYNRKVKLIKWNKDIRIQSIIDMAVSFYSSYGITATNRKDDWMFELM